jgi:hypothetical protein
VMTFDMILIHSGAALIVKLGLGEVTIREREPDRKNPLNRIDFEVD